MDTDKSCEERWADSLAGRIETLKEFLLAYDNASNTDDSVFEEMHDFGLSWDWVFSEKKAPYLRFLMSWGGPSDEFRFYFGPGWVCRDVEYAFLDWFDGHVADVEGDDLEAVLRFLELNVDHYTAKEMYTREWERHME